MATNIQVTNSPANATAYFIRSEYFGRTPSFYPVPRGLLQAEKWADEERIDGARWVEIVAIEGGVERLVVRYHADDEGHWLETYLDDDGNEVDEYGERREVEAA